MDILRKKLGILNSWNSLTKNLLTKSIIVAKTFKNKCQKQRIVSLAFCLQLLHLTLVHQECEFLACLIELSQRGATITSFLIEFGVPQWHSPLTGLTIALYVTM